MHSFAALNRNTREDHSTLPGLICNCGFSPFPRRVPAMQKLDFAEALDLIVSHDSRYAREAYHFLRDALDYTIKLKKKAREDASGHVTGQELLDGIRLYALKEFGPMVPTVFEYWGLSKGDDFGEMVFNLIRVGIFGKTDRDSLDDFRGGYTFHEAFVIPFRPKQPAEPERVAEGEPAEELN